MIITVVTPVIAIHAIVSIAEITTEVNVGITRNNTTFTIKSIGNARESSLYYTGSRNFPNHQEIIKIFDVLKIMKSSPCLSHSSDEYT